MEELVICSECAAEAVGPATTEQLELEGWDFSGEYGPRCPECFVLNTAPEQTEGLGGVIAALGATKKEE